MDINAIVAMISDVRYPPKEMFLIRYTLQASVHSIWREINSRRHGEESKDAITLSKLVWLHLLAVKDKGPAYLERALLTWFGTRHVPSPS